MIKRDLIKALEGVADDAYICVVSSEHDIDDDMYWGRDYETEIVRIHTKDDCAFVVVEADTFD